MNAHFLGLSDNTCLLVAAIVFILLFVIILKSLRQASFFGGKTAVVLSLCVSLLSIIGMLRFFGIGDGIRSGVEGSRQGRNFDVILLPYAALGVAVLLSLLFAFLMKIFKKPKVEKYNNEFYRGEERRYPFADTREHVEKPDEKDRTRK